MDRLQQQLNFIVEIDKLKSIIRKTRIADSTRHENSAEHSWQLALMALTLAEHANEPIDIMRVVKMVLVHDIVEIDAGDTFLFDEAGHEDKAEREQKAAERLFGLLPADIAQELRAIWDEFEARQTASSRFANALDRIAPLLLNYETKGGSWREYNISADRVLKRVAYIQDGSQTLWEYTQKLIASAVALGYLPKE